MTGIALLLLLAISPASAADVLARYELLIADSSPGSTAVMQDESYLIALRQADPAKANKLVLQKSLLRDLAHMVEDYQDEDMDAVVGAIRDGLRTDYEAQPVRQQALDAMGLGPEARKLPVWIGKTYGPEKQKLFERASWDWASLAEDQKRWLSDRGNSAERWGQLSFRGRDSQLNDWAREEFPRLNERMARARNEAEADAAHDRWYEVVRPALDRDDVQVRQKNLDETFSLRKYSALAAKDRGITADPRLRALLDRASDESLSPEARLSALSTLYDNRLPSGVESRVPDILRADAPPGPGQKIDDHAGKLLVAMMPDAYFREISGTVAGDRVIQFYKNHTLKLRIEEEDLSTYASYDSETDEITIGKREIEEWVRVHKMTVAGLIQDGKAFRQMIEESAQVFVHEATHQMQRAAEHDRGLKRELGNQRIEINARFVESAYIAEKWDKSASLRERVKTAPGTSFARMVVKHVKDFHAGPVNLARRTVLYDYSGSMSVPHAHALRRAWGTRQSEALRQELEYRQTMDPEERGALERNGFTRDKFSDGWGAPKVFELSIRKTRESALREMLKEVEENIENMDATTRARAEYYSEMDKQEQQVWRKLDGGWRVAGP